MFTRFASCLLLGAVTIVASAHAGTVVYQDDSFAEADWTQQIFFVEGNGGDVQAWHVGSGGNPGEFRMVQTVVNDAPPYTGVGAFFGYVPALYDPAASGAILTIDYKEDAMMFAGGGQGQATGPAVRQAGVVYYFWVGGTAEWTWTEKLVTGLTAVDFRDTPFTDLHPDFSSAGAPLEVGFYRANSTYSGGYTIQAGIDNWTFTIHNDGPTLRAQTTWGRVRSLYR